jgi:hypothetical protein
MVMPKATADACITLRLLVTRGREAVRRMRASRSRSMTSFSAAVPPLTKPTPSRALKTFQDRVGMPDFTAAR